MSLAETKAIEAGLQGLAMRRQIGMRMGCRAGLDQSDEMQHTRAKWVTFPGVPAIQK